MIAEISANHHHDIEKAIHLIGLAKDCGADAVKLQHYTPDTMTIDCDADVFKVGEGTIWEGRNLYDLYGEAHTPWGWTGRLFEAAADAGITIFSTPFDATSVDFLEQFSPPAYKIASFELVDLPLIRRVAQTGKPVIMSTGMGSLAEICEAVEALRGEGAEDFALLKCTSAYPAPAAEANLARIPHMAATFGVPVGLSDHTMGSAIPCAAAALGACIVEKHFIVSRSEGGPDAAFSMEPGEFRRMVEDVRAAEAAVGCITYGRTPKEISSLVFRRSLFAVEDIAAGEELTGANVRVIRPGYGLAPKFLPQVLGRRAKCLIPRGTPLAWGHLA
ncbi:MAG: pseudaminic acid synthase [Verrucomicrobiales bacterium]